MYTTLLKQEHVGSQAKLPGIGISLRYAVTNSTEQFYLTVVNTEYSSGLMTVRHRSCWFYVSANRIVSLASFT